MSQITPLLNTITSIAVNVPATGDLKAAEREEDSEDSDELDNEVIEKYNACRRQVIETTIKNSSLKNEQSFPDLSKSIDEVNLFISSNIC